MIESKKRVGVDTTRATKLPKIQHLPSLINIERNGNNDGLSLHDSIHRYHAYLSVQELKQLRLASKDFYTVIARCDEIGGRLKYSMSELNYETKLLEPFSEIKTFSVNLDYLKSLEPHQIAHHITDLCTLKIEVVPVPEPGHQEIELNIEQFDCLELELVHRKRTWEENLKFRAGLAVVKSIRLNSNCTKVKFGSDVRFKDQGVVTQLMQANALSSLTLHNIDLRTAELGLGWNLPDKIDFSQSSLRYLDISAEHGKPRPKLMLPETLEYLKVVMDCLSIDDVRFGDLLFLREVHLIERPNSSTRGIEKPTIEKVLDLSSMKRLERLTLAGMPNGPRGMTSTHSSRFWTALLPSTLQRLFLNNVAFGGSIDLLPCRNTLSLLHLWNSRVKLLYVNDLCHLEDIHWSPATRCRGRRLERRPDLDPDMIDFNRFKSLRKLYVEHFTMINPAGSHYRDVAEDAIPIKLRPLDFSLMPLTSLSMIRCDMYSSIQLPNTLSFLELEDVKMKVAMSLEPCASTLNNLRISCGWDNIDQDQLVKLTHLRKLYLANFYNKSRAMTPKFKLPPNLVNLLIGSSGDFDKVGDSCLESVDIVECRNLETFHIWASFHQQIHHPPKAYDLDIGQSSITELETSGVNFTNLLLPTSLQNVKIMGACIANPIDFTRLENLKSLDLDDVQYPQEETHFDFSTLSKLSEIDISSRRCDFGGENIVYLNIGSLLLPPMITKLNLSMVRMRSEFVAPKTLEHLQLSGLYNLDAKAPDENPIRVDLSHSVLKSLALTLPKVPVGRTMYFQSLHLPPTLDTLTFDMFVTNEEVSCTGVEHLLPEVNRNGKLFQYYPVSHNFFELLVDPEQLFELFVDPEPGEDEPGEDEPGEDEPDEDEPGEDEGSDLRVLICDGRHI